MGGITIGGHYLTIMWRFSPFRGSDHARAGMERVRERKGLLPHFLEREKEGERACVRGGYREGMGEKKAARLGERMKERGSAYVRIGRECRERVECVGEGIG